MIEGFRAGPETGKEQKRGKLSRGLWEGWVADWEVRLFLVGEIGAYQ